MAKLVLIPTPIGNLGDITFRAVEQLKNANIIFCEDTRHSKKLLQHLGIDKKLISYHKFNEHKQIDHFVELIKKNELCALISDAGTPGISDPGFLLVNACIESNIGIETLPGPTAFVPALLNSGFPCDRFCFEGFLPHKKGRQSRLLALANEERTLVFYESPYRLVKLLEQIAEFIDSERDVCVSRELSKMFEENRRGTVADLTEYYKNNTPKGEIVVVLKGKEIKK